MSQSVIQLLIDCKAVKVRYDSTVNDNGATKESATHLDCSYCNTQWKYMKTGAKPTKVTIVKHLSIHHMIEWTNLTTLYPILTMSLTSSPRSESSSRTTSIDSADVSNCSSPLVRRSSSKRTASTSLTGVSDQTVYDEDHNKEEISNTAIHDVVTGFALFNMSFATAESPHFRKFIRKFIQSAAYLMQERGIYRRVLKQWTLEYASELRIKLLVFLTQPNFYCTLAVDGWTNVCGDKVWNIMIICKGVSYYWCSLVNHKSLEYMSAEYIYNKVC